MAKSTPRLKSRATAQLRLPITPKLRADLDFLKTTMGSSSWISTAMFAVSYLADAIRFTERSKEQTVVPDTSEEAQVNSYEGEQLVAALDRVTEIEKHMTDPGYCEGCGS